MYKTGIDNFEQVGKTSDGKGIVVQDYQMQAGDPTPEDVEAKKIIDQAVLPPLSMDQMEKIDFDKKCDDQPLPELDMYNLESYRSIGNAAPLKPVKNTSNTSLGNDTIKENF